MTITQEARKAVYNQNCSKVFCNILSIEHPSLDSPLRYIDNTQGVTSGDMVYEPRGFDFTPPSPDSEDDSATIAIDDVDRVLSKAFQTMERGCAETSVSMIRFDEPDVVIDGPYRYKVIGFTKSSASGQVRLSLSRLAPLDANASRAKYTASEFPGLYG